MVLMFHSSELMPGGSPFWPDRQAVRRLYSMLEGFLWLLHRQGVEFPSLTALSEGMDQGSLPVRCIQNGKSRSDRLVEAQLGRLIAARQQTLGAGGVLGPVDGREETQSRRMTAV